LLAPGPQADDAVATIFQWLYSRIEDVHSGDYSEAPSELQATAWAGPVSGDAGEQEAAASAEQPVVPNDGSS
jgi:hypothetical protein